MKNVRREGRHIIVNEEKQEFGIKEISFQVHVITKYRVNINDKEVRAIDEMQPSTDVAGFRRLCGMV